MKGVGFGIREFPKTGGVNYFGVVLIIRILLFTISGTILGSFRKLGVPYFGVLILVVE